VKFENQSPTRSFKGRGAINRLAELLPNEREVGVVTASTGNHGLAVAYAGKLLNVPSVVVVSESAPEIKCEAIRRYGGELRVAGRDFTEAVRFAREVARNEKRTYLEDGNDGKIMAGTATLGWEILEDLPDADVIVVPVGGGNLIAAVSLVAKMLNPRIRVVGVQSDAAPSAARSLQSGRLTEARCETFAEGIATSLPGELAFEVMKRHVDEVRLVCEDDLRRGILTALQATGQIAEGAGAASFAALEEYGSEWTGLNVVLILSGGNLPIAHLRTLLADHDSSWASAHRSRVPGDEKGK
jgi:threonine dehydratase